MNRIGLTQLPRKLAEHTGQPAPSYRKCFDGAVADRFPAEFAGNRWTVSEADLPAIAKALGMAAAAIPAPVKARRATRQADRVAA